MCVCVLSVCVYDFVRIQWNKLFVAFGLYYVRNWRFTARTGGIADVLTTTKISGMRREKKEEKEEEDII